MSEDQLQKAAKQFLDLRLPKTALHWHTPNGGKRNAREAAKLKAMGTLAGIPDIFILYDGTLHCVELKARGKYFSPVQRTVKTQLDAAGAEYYPKEVRSLEDLENALQWFGLPFRARVA